ncbi:MAG TPA: DUF4440 domain-containing protein [Woeseiaceae bacterium]
MLIGACLALGFACGDSRERPVLEDPSTARAELDSLWAGLKRAMISGDTAALTLLYSDSAYFSETGSPTLRGKGAILAATADVFACCEYVESDLDVEITDVIGDRALQFGTYRDVIRPHGQPALAIYGRVDAMLERNTDGRWLIRRLTVIRDSMVAVPPGSIP